MLLCGGILLRKDIIYYLWLQCVFGVNNIAFKNGMSFLIQPKFFIMLQSMIIKSAIASHLIL